MRREDCLDVFQRLPQHLHSSVHLVLRNQFVISVDVVARFEPHYIVLRGREGGSTDEGRGFFIPYDEIAYLRIERTVKVGELKSYYGETGYVDQDDLMATLADESSSANGKTEVPGKGTAAPPASPAGNPGAVARHNLLERIRTTRANLGGTTGRLPPQG
jgi:hypothetical protein